MHAHVKRERERDGWKFAVLHPVNHDHYIRAKTDRHAHTHKCTIFPRETHKWLRHMYTLHTDSRRWYPSHFGCMVGRDCSNPMQLDPSVLNILAETQSSQNWRVKARRRSMHSTLLLLKSYNLLWSGLSFTSVRTLGAPGLADVFTHLEYSNLY